jgi:RNA-binding protein
MESNPLTSAEKKELRGIAQRLKPHIRIGKNGLGSAVLAEIEIALSQNGLIKIRFDTPRETTKSLYEEIPTRTNSEFVGSVGRVGIFFREMSEKK